MLLASVHPLLVRAGHLFVLVRSLGRREGAGEFAGDAQRRRLVVVRHRDVDRLVCLLLQLLTELPRRWRVWLLAGRARGLRGPDGRGGGCDSRVVGEGQNPTVHVGEAQNPTVHVFDRLPRAWKVAKRGPAAISGPRIQRRTFSDACRMCRKPQKAATDRLRGPEPNGARLRPLAAGLESRQTRPCSDFGAQNPTAHVFGRLPHVPQAAKGGNGPFARPRTQRRTSSTACRGLGKSPNAALQRFRGPESNGARFRTPAACAASRKRRQRTVCEAQNPTAHVFDRLPRAWKVAKRGPAAISGPRIQRRTFSDACRMCRKPQKAATDRLRGPEPNGVRSSRLSRGIRSTRPRHHKYKAKSRSQVWRLGPRALGASVGDRCFVFLTAMTSKTKYGWTWSTHPSPLTPSPLVHSTRTSGPLVLLLRAAGHVRFFHLALPPPHSIFSPRDRIRRMHQDGVRLVRTRHSRPRPVGTTAEVAPNFSIFLLRPPVQKERKDKEDSPAPSPTTMPLAKQPFARTPTDTFVDAVRATVPAATVGEAGIPHNVHCMSETRMHDQCRMLVGRVIVFGCKRATDPHDVPFLFHAGILLPLTSPSSTYFVKMSQSFNHIVGVQQIIGERTFCQYICGDSCVTQATLIPPHLLVIPFMHLHHLPYLDTVIPLNFLPPPPPTRRRTFIFTKTGFVGTQNNKCKRRPKGYRYRNTAKCTHTPPCPPFESRAQQYCHDLSISLFAPFFCPTVTISGDTQVGSGSHRQRLSRPRALGAFVGDPYLCFNCYDLTKPKKE